MTESYQEQHPLLCEEYCDEELGIQDTGPKFHRRFRHSVRTGRARTHAAGAAAIITSWPDDISSLLAYWWIALGMFAFMVFLIYNSFIAMAVVPRVHSPSNLNSSKDTIQSKSDEPTSEPNIYMHVFVANYEEFKSNDYIPYVQTIAKKYTNFNYNLVVVLNDTVNDISDEQKNEMALNILWSDNNIITVKSKSYKNPTVKYISLNEYMDNSPLKKYWRLVPYQFIGFLVQCIAIWDKGGVAFNPSILTPNSPNLLYLEKLHGVLGSFQSNNRLISIPKRKILKKSKKKLNNIRDIIMELENGENLNENNLSDSLLEAENVPDTVTSIKAKRNAKLISFDQDCSRKSKGNEKDEILPKNDSSNKRKSDNFIKPIKAMNSTKANGLAAAQSILPKFLEFFFQFNSKNLTSITKNFTNDATLSENATNATNYIKKDATLSENAKNNMNNDSTSEIAPVVKESINKAKTKYTKKSYSRNENTKLIIDLKGNLIATEIGCHAFIGTVFSNVFHHTDDESLTDFIIHELSLFCKGSLSTCNNVEVILL